MGMTVINDESLQKAIKKGYANKSVQTALCKRTHDFNFVFLRALMAPFTKPK
jgi:hypothetical protein